VRRGELVDRLPASVAIPLRARFGRQDPEIRILKRFVKPGDTVVDVGAHRGAYTWHLSRLAGSTGHVYAFEPQPELVERLRSWNGTNVVVHAVGLSDHAGSANLTIPVWGNTSMLGHATLESAEAVEDARHLEVRTKMLDEFDLSPTLIKVDVEGHEVSVLRGGDHTVSSSRPVLLLEIDYRHQGENDNRQKLIVWLKERDYVAHYVKQGVLTVFGELPHEDDPNEQLSQADYVYNWFMLPVERIS